jgi:hypothetical protein
VGKDLLFMVRKLDNAPDPSLQSFEVVNLTNSIGIVSQFVKDGVYFTPTKVGLSFMFIEFFLNPATCV